MPDHHIEREVMIDAPADVVWRTLTEPDLITKWFADRVELDATAGGRGVLVFKTDDGATRPAPLVVVAAERPTRFSFRWGHPEGAEPAATNSLLVEFTLVAEGEGRTRLRVVETGLELLSWPETDKASYAADHRDGWKRGLGRLGALFEG